MNKVLDLLEKYCEWLAIAAGAVFLGLMVWTYLLFAPIAVPNGQTTVTPTDVDTIVKQNYADPLASAMHDEHAEMPPAQHVSAGEKWAQTLDGTATAVALRSDWSAGTRVAIGATTPRNAPVQLAVVTKLPDVPPADPLDSKSARAYIADVPPAVVPGQPAAAPVPPNAVPPGRDLSYARIVYQIVPDEIDKNFDAVGIPAQFRNTSIMAIRVMREEQLPDGSWGAPSDVPVINNGVTIQTPPDNNADQTAITQFRQWAESQQGQSDLLHPPFFRLLMGEGPWDPPADELPVIDPAVEQQKRIEAAKARQEEEKRKRLSQPRRAPSGANRPPPNQADGYIAPLEWPQAAPMGTPPVRTPVAPRIPSSAVPADVPPTDSSPAGRNIPAVPGEKKPAANTLPNPIFKPAGVPPLVGWAYDDTVVEGNTYRYQVLYGIKSPVFQTTNLCKNPEDTKTLVLWSKPDDTKWTAPVIVKPSAEYFLTGASWSTNPPGSVKVEVFKWAQGKWQSQTFAVAAGDGIGSSDGTTDFHTGSTVVDLRYDPRLERAYLLALAPDGQLVERYPKTDRDSPRVKQLQAAVQIGKGIIPGAAPQPGAPPMPGRGGPAGVPDNGLNPDGTQG